MKRVRKAILSALIVCLLSGGFQPWAWAETEWQEDASPVQDLYNVFDILLVRPASALAGVAGIGMVILSLPFTLPTHSVDEATELFVHRPFRFAFQREFPDEDIY
jgi:hypothetical protein